MSVSIATASPAQSTWLQRLTGTEPKTVVTETSRTEITNTPGGRFNLKTALRNGGIGAAVAGALGGVSLLGKVALPVIGKVVSIGGLAKLAGVGGAIGIATAALPVLAPKIKESPAAKAAVTGAAIGAAAGLVLPLIPMPIGAAIGAGVGLLVHHRRNRPAPDYAQYPGFQAYPGYHPVGIGDGPVPPGLVPVTPNYGMYGGTAMNPYAMGMPGYPAPGTVQGYPAGYGMQGGYQPGYGMSLPAQAQGMSQPVGAMPVAAPVAASKPAVRRPAAATPKFKGAKTFTDGAGNLRQVGTGTILRPAKAGAASAGTGIGSVPAGMGAPAGMAMPQAGLSQLANPSSYLPGMSGTLPFAGGSPFSAGTAAMAGLTAMPQAMASMSPAAGVAPGIAPALAGVQPGALPARPVA